MKLAGFSETLRQIVHITMGGWALLLRWITWQQAALLALAALAFNAFVLPRFGGRRLYRESDRGGAARGILIYPIAVLLLVLVFRHRLDIAAAAWGIMAAGDGFATIAGRAVGRRRLPWNRDKTVEGTLAFILAGSAAGVLLALWVRTSIYARAIDRVRARRAGRRGDRRRARRNYSRQARRQHLGAGQRRGAFSGWRA